MPVSRKCTGPSIYREIEHSSVRSPKEGRFALDPGRETRPLQDTLGISPRAGIAVCIHVDAEMPQVRERAGQREIREREPVADEISAIVRNDPFDVFEDRRQLVILGSRGNGLSEP